MTLKWKGFETFLGPIARHKGRIAIDATHHLAPNKMCMEKIHAHGGMQRNKLSGKYQTSAPWTWDNRLLYFFNAAIRAFFVIVRRTDEIPVRKEYKLSRTAVSACISFLKP